jgi:DNA-binding transcriptional regulator YiaG
MSGDELAAIRKRLGMSPTKFGRALGYTGNPNSLRLSVKRYEDGSKPIPGWIARLAIMFERHGVPDDFLADGDQSE